MNNWWADVESDLSFNQTAEIIKINKFQNF